VTELAARHRLPAVYPYSAFAKDGLRNGQPQRFRGLEVDHEIKLRWLLNGTQR
jgi:hypothetical protein